MVSVSNPGIAPPPTTPRRSTPEDQARSERIRIKNRRKRYLDLHPEYFTSSELELSDPLLYDRFVRVFQTPAEREARARERNASKPTTITGDVLETNLVRSEAKLEAVRNPDPNSPVVYRRAANGEIVSFEQDEDDRARSKEDGWERWTDVMGQRFSAGEDRGFEYEEVDGNEELDDWEEEDRERLERWMDEGEGDEDGGGEEERSEGRRLRAQTGIQDF